jgi:hypothetical protein
MIFLVIKKATRSALRKCDVTRDIDNLKDERF